MKKTVRVPLNNEKWWSGYKERLEATDIDFSPRSTDEVLGLVRKIMWDQYLEDLGLLGRLKVYLKSRFYIIYVDCVIKPKNYE